MSLSAIAADEPTRWRPPPTCAREGAGARRRPGTKPGRLQELIEGAGFVDDITVEAVDLTITESFEDWWRVATEMSRSGPQMAGREDEFHAALSGYRGEDGLLRLPGRTWVAAATA